MVKERAMGICKVFNRSGFPKFALICVFFLTFYAFSTVSLAAGNTYYVDQNHLLANDFNPGTEELPWLTIQHAADTVQAGDTVIVREGAYSERVTVQVSGTGTARIVFSVKENENAIMEG